MNELPFVGKRVLVTGAGLGQELAIALHFAAQSADLVLGKVIQHGKGQSIQACLCGQFATACLGSRFARLICGHCKKEAPALFR